MVRAGLAAERKMTLDDDAVRFEHVLKLATRTRKPAAVAKSASYS